MCAYYTITLLCTCIYIYVYVCTYIYIYIYTYTYICQLCQYRIFPSIAITHNQFKYLQTSGRTSARDTTGFAVGSRTPCFTVTKCVIFPCCFKLYTSFPICAFEMYFQISKYIIFYVCIYIYINKHIIVCMYVYIYIHSICTVLSLWYSNLAIKGPFCSQFNGTIIDILSILQPNHGWMTLEALWPYNFPPIPSRHFFFAARFKAVPVEAPITFRVIFKSLA